MSRWHAALIVIFLLIGCTTPSSAPPPASVETIIVKPEPLSQTETLVRYSLERLGAALNLSEVLLADSYEPEGEGIVGCRIESDEMRKWKSKLQDLVDAQADRERTSYVEDPTAFARKHGFDGCSLRCECAVFYDVLKPVDPRSFSRAKVRASHQAFLKKLKIKLARQSAEEKRQCAENQTWFCASDLRTHLEATARD